MHDSIIISVTQKYAAADGCETIQRAIIAQDPSVIGNVMVTPERITARCNMGYDRYDEAGDGGLSGDYEPEVVSYSCTPELTKKIESVGRTYTLRDNFGQFFVKLDWLNGKASLLEDVEGRKKT